MGAAGKKKVAIIGAGPSGLFAAELLSKDGFAVSLYDQMPNPARKFLLAGRGGLNLTHSEPFEQFMTRYGDATEWLSPAITAFTPTDLRTWCEGLGIETFVGSSGRVFPQSMKAVPLLRAWLARLADYGVAYHPRHRWIGWEGEALLIADTHNNTVKITPDATLFALGGASWPRLGSDAAWMSAFADAGVDLVPFRPANCGFETAWSGHFAERYAGAPLKSVRLQHGGQSCMGEAMITARGIEGGAIYALSSVLRTTLERDGKAVLSIDLKPDVSEEKLAAKLGRSRGSKSFSTFLKGSGISAVGAALLREAFLKDNVTTMPPHVLAAAIKSIPLTLTATTGLERAISSAGGISREAVSHDFMLKAKQGVFVAGEMLDWEAPTGGYLLQACFSTAMTAAQGIAGFCNSR